MQTRRKKGTGGVTYRSDGSCQITHTWRDEFDCARKIYFYGSPKAESKRTPKALTDELRSALGRDPKQTEIFAYTDALAKKTLWLEEHKNGGARGSVRNERTVGEILDYCLGKSGTATTPEILGSFHKDGRRIDRQTKECDRRYALGELKRLRTLSLSRLETNHISDLVRSVAERYPRTAQKVRSLIKLCLDEAIVMGWLKGHNVADLAAKPKYKRKTKRIFSLLQWLELLDACMERPVDADAAPFQEWLSEAFAELRAHGVAGLAQFVRALPERNSGAAYFIKHTCLMALYDRAWAAISGGLSVRRNEMAGFLRSDYDPHYKREGLADGWGVIHIHRQRDEEDTKTESGRRSVPVPPIVAQCINDVLEAINLLHPFNDTIYLFPSTKRSGIAVDSSTITHRLPEAIKRAGLPERTVHELRHSANNILRQMGVPSIVRRDILGHSSTAVTDEVYSQTVEAEVIDAMKLFQEKAQQAQRELRERKAQPAAKVEAS